MVWYTVLRASPAVSNKLVIQNSFFLFFRLQQSLLTSVERELFSKSTEPQISSRLYQVPDPKNYFIVNLYFYHLKAGIKCNFFLKKKMTATFRSLNLLMIIRST